MDPELKAKIASIDLTDNAMFSDGPPHDAFKLMRQHAPVLWNPPNADWNSEESGFWSITRAVDIAAIGRDWERFSSHGGMHMETEAMAPLELQRTFMMIQDPPEHTLHRGLVNRAFTPARVRGLEPAIRRIVTSVIDEVAERGECDFTKDVAVPIPLHVICELMDIPVEDRADILRWTNSVATFQDTDSAAGGSGADAMGAATEYMVRHLDRGEGSADSQNIIGALRDATVDGGAAMPVEERAGLFIQLFAAGNETTRSALSMGIQTLIGHPDERQKLIDDPSLIPGAVDEILRYVCVAYYLRRDATEDVELHGQKIAAGDKVLNWVASAAFDPDFIDRPEVFDVSRARCPHLAFGPGGRHYCVGAGLGRLELQIALEEILTRMPEMEITGPITRIEGNFINGHKSMPVAFTPSTVYA